jgi:prevent-host-death family protein
MEVTAKDLKFFLKEILDTVNRGEEVIITYRGKPQAKIVPVESKITPHNNLFGIWRDNDATKDVYEYLRNSRKARFDAN